MDESSELEELDLGGQVSPGSLFQLSAVTLDTGLHAGLPCSDSDSAVTVISYLAPD